MMISSFNAIIGLRTMLFHYIFLVMQGLTEKEYVSRKTSAMTYKIKDNHIDNLTTKKKIINLKRFFALKGIPKSAIPF